MLHCESFDGRVSSLDRTLAAPGQDCPRVANIGHNQVLTHQYSSHSCATVVPVSSRISLEVLLVCVHKRFHCRPMQKVGSRTMSRCNVVCLQLVLIAVNTFALRTCQFAGHPALAITLSEMPERCPFCNALKSGSR